MIACNAAAQAEGVQVGQLRSAAQALAAGLHLARRRPEQEAALLDSLAAWALQFTPTVCLDPPAGLLLEIGGCLRYFQGLERLRRLVAEGLAAFGPVAMDAVAPTALAATWLARRGNARAIVEPAELAETLARLALGGLPWPAERQRRLQALGLRRFGQLTALPRDGLSRRFGPGLLDEMDRARGLTPDPREAFVPAEVFDRRIVLHWATEQVEALGFVAKRLLAELAGFLAGRGLGAQQLALELCHEGKPPTGLLVGLGKPTRSAEAMLAILRERLGRFALPAPVEAVRLRVDALHRLDGLPLGLFGTARAAGDFDLLLARMAARLGAEAIKSVACQPDHRPERAWRLVPAGTASPALPVGERPGWLLPEPLPLAMRDERPWYGEPLRLLGRAERIESGWWDGEAVARDYYQAEGPSGRRYWIYRQRGEGGWFLHGLFG